MLVSTGVSCRKEGAMRRQFTVYRVNYAIGRRDPIGSITERRDKERGRNLLGLLIEARRVFGNGTSEAINIVLDAPRGTAAREQAFSRGVVTVTSRINLVVNTEPGKTEAV
jgi:hypothetical protein